MAQFSISKKEYFNNMIAELLIYCATATIYTESSNPKCTKVITSMSVLLRVEWKISVFVQEQLL